MPRQANRTAHPADLSLTERRNPRTVDIDLASSLEIVDLMAGEDAAVRLRARARRRVRKIAQWRALIISRAEA